MPNKKQIKIHIHPPVVGEDKGEGGVGRVVRMQIAGMNAATETSKRYKFTLVDDAANADVIASHIYIPSEYLNKWPEKAYVEHCHGLYWDEYRWGNWAIDANRVVGEAMRIADAVTVPSEWVGNVVRREFQRNCTVVYHGINAEEWTVQPSNGYVFFDKTRTDPVCETESLSIIAKNLPHIQFVSTANVANTSPNIKQIGVVPYATAKELMEKAGCYLATTRETFGMSILQALACGVPVVGYDWGGLREIAALDTDGCITLVKPGDVAALAESVSRVIGTRNSTKIVQNFTIPNAMEKYHAVWAEAYEKRRRKTNKVDVILTAYNLAEYLPTAIESVISQTLTDWKLYVFVDKSPDNCAEIANDYALKDSRIIVIDSPINYYLAGARNEAIKLGNGEYILALDADDSLMPNALKTLSEYLDYNRLDDIAYGGLLFKELDGKLWESGWPVDWTSELVFAGKNVQPYCSMYRRRVWETIGGYRRRYKTMEDADFWARAALAGFRSKKVTSSPMLTYLIRPNSMSATMGTANYLSWLPRRLPAGVQAMNTLPVPSLDPPVIGVVIPVGNGHQRYLPDALDSLYSQDYKNWKCVVVNDTGDNLHVPFWAKVIDGPRTGSVADTRNAGIKELSDCAFIIPLDADDYFQPDALTTMMEAAAQTNYESIVYPDFWEDDKVEGEFTHFKTQDFNCKFLVDHGPIYTAVCMYPRKYWEKVGGYRSGYKGWEDWGLQLSFAAEGFPARRIARPLFTYRKWTGQRRITAEKNFEDSKAEILRDFNPYFNGRPLMACGCGASQVSTFGGSAANVANSPLEGATLVAYDGPQIAPFSIRGPATNKTYRFRKGESVYVYDADVERIIGLAGFSIAEPIAKEPALS